MPVQAAPRSGTSCGLVTSLSAIERLRLNVPTAMGANFTLILQLELDATLAAQGTATE
jgi:hypothetical protein